MRIQFGIRPEAPMFYETIGRSYLRELGTRLSPIAVIAASAAIENSRCKFFAQRATGS